MKNIFTLANYNNSLLSKARRRIIRSLKILLFSNNYCIYSRKTHDFHNISFSQEGEDLVLKCIFGSQEKGFYVDVGAHHPLRFSNTYIFYLKGWRGINIDAMPGSMEPFKKLRSEDINLEAAISDSSEELTYYSFNEPLLNGFSEEISSSRVNPGCYIVDKKQIQTIPLSKILDKYLPRDQEIDFLSIDVEGLDYQVLLSNNWSKYKPKVILVEELFMSLENIPYESKTFSLLKDRGYKLFAKTFNTSIYKLVNLE